jgi:hypothetical protein
MQNDTPIRAIRIIRGRKQHINIIFFNSLFLLTTLNSKKNEKIQVFHDGSSGTLDGRLLQRRD